MPEIAQNKSELRKHFRQLRSELTEQHQQHATALVTRNFLNSITISSHDVISAYYPLKNELSPLPILKELHAMGNITALPVIEAKDSPLIFRQWQEGDDLYEHSEFKIQEPVTSAPKVTPTIMIVPLLAFDLSGHRLGYGGGFFDRTIHKLKKNDDLITVGIGYSIQQTTLLPTHAHDHLLDYLVTEEGVLRF